MTVDLRSDLVTSDFWQGVREHLLREARGMPHGMGVDSIIIRPRTREDDFFSRDPATYNLTPKRAKHLDRDTADIRVDGASRTATIVVPDDETWHSPDDGHVLGADELAEDFTDWIVAETGMSDRKRAHEIRRVYLRTPKRADRFFLARAGRLSTAGHRRTTRCPTFLRRVKWP